MDHFAGAGKMVDWIVSGLEARLLGTLKRLFITPPLRVALLLS